LTSTSRKQETIVEAARKSVRRIRRASAQAKGLAKKNEEGEERLASNALSLSSVVEVMKEEMKTE